MMDKEEDAVHDGPEGTAADKKPVMGGAAAETTDDRGLGPTGGMGPIRAV